MLGCAVFLTGCVSIKSQSAVQRAPGVVELRGVVCASDYDSSESTTCRVSNIAERDNGTGDAVGSGPGPHPGNLTNGCAYNQYERLLHAQPYRRIP